MGTVYVHHLYASGKVHDANRRGRAINRTLLAQIGSGEAENAPELRKASPVQLRVHWTSIGEREMTPERMEGKESARVLREWHTKDVDGRLAETQAHCSGSDGRPRKERSAGVAIHECHVGASEPGTSRPTAK